MPFDNESPHYAVQVLYRRERVVAEMLEGYGYKPFLPVYKERHKWSDRVAQIELPLFPGYIFCPIDLDNKLPVLSTPGVLGIVGAGKLPIPVDSKELDALRTIVFGGVDVSPCQALPGQRVRIEGGPLHGLKGELVHTRGAARFVVSISLLNRSVSATFVGSRAIPIKDA